jgi:hypothetical protein
MSVQFTRYLFEKTWVEYSVEQSILLKQKEDVLFWIYELYWSGFVEDTWKILQEIQCRHFSSIYPAYSQSIAEKKRLSFTWDDNSVANAIGSIAVTLCLRRPPNKYAFRLTPDVANLYKNAADAASPHALFRSVHTRLTQPIHVPISFSVQTASSSKTFKPDPTSSSPTIMPDPTSSSPTIMPDPIPSPKEVRDIYLHGDWLYYCLSTPIWVERLFAYSISVDNVNRVVRFDDEDDMESFIELYGYYPEEQPPQIHILHGI